MRKLKSYWVIIIIIALFSSIIGYYLTIEKTKTKDNILKSQIMDDYIDSMQSYFYKRDNHILKNELDVLNSSEELFLEDSPIFLSDSADSLAVSYIHAVFRIHHELKNPKGALKFMNRLQNRFCYDYDSLTLSLNRHRIIANIYYQEGQIDKSNNEIMLNISILENRLSEKGYSNNISFKDIYHMDIESQNHFALICYLLYNTALIDKNEAKEKLSRIRNEYNMSEDATMILEETIESSDIENISFF